MLLLQSECCFGAKYSRGLPVGLDTSPCPSEGGGIIYTPMVTVIVSENMGRMVAR